ncbi:MAG: hypothetical protein ACE5O2_06040, partial [Armatimonadota bacterium]
MADELSQQCSHTIHGIVYNRHVPKHRRQWCGSHVLNVRYVEILSSENVLDRSHQPRFSAIGYLQGHAPKRRSSAAQHGAR